LITQLEMTASIELAGRGTASMVPLTNSTFVAPACSASVLKVIAEPTRLRLLSLVAAEQDGEECICNLTERVGISQPTVSHHMKVLADAGLVEREQRGKWAYFRLIPGALDALGQVVSTVAQPAGARGVTTTR
jgi:ArsR family transcriptional regulator